MKLGDVIGFRDDLYFGGAIQADWFYDRVKAANVAENFVFHSKNYFGVTGNAQTIDTVSLLKELAGKIGKDTKNPRSLAIADYGTGKSHFAVTLAVLFSGPEFMPKTYKKVLENITKIDAESASELTTLCKDRNFVIMLNGIRDFNLHSELLKATQKSLRLYGIDDSELKKINHTIETANRFFELNSKSHISDFEEAAVGRGWNEKGQALRTKISEGIGADDTAFDIVNDVYELITGQRIRWEEGISAKAILEMLLNRYCGLNGQFDNVILLFDEFGRYLEYASGTDGGKCGDNALQEIFEVSQNASGMLQVINFIQADIKTYLLRVDQSRNLSRYIGRYDESDKFHISSNIETVFANLIDRKDIAVFNEKIVTWLDSNENVWKSVFAKINKWTQTTGIWSDYEKFRKVIVEGIYPLHPISVFMLSRLSDYFQKRSSMNLINQYITGVSNIELKTAMPLVLPTELMKGDLFSEMIAAETSGRHRSDFCIRFENVLKKNEQKLNKKQIAVLRANLITRALRFNTQSYAEAILSLRLCSGLSESDVNEALSILVDEYAVLAFDEMAGCFDFTEDAKGAYSYKILKQRLLSKQEVDLRKLFNTATILELGEFDQNQQTNFGTNHRILTNEWCFTQKVMLADDINEGVAKGFVDTWKQARSVVVPKGTLIWVYINKDNDYVLEKLQKIASTFNGTPIVMMLLNDADNKLKNILSEYNLLDHIDTKTRDEYANFFIKDLDKVKENIKNTFSSLKKGRTQITEKGINVWRKRIPIALTEVFDKVYPSIVSYNFDGLLTNSNNFTGNGARYYCRILMLLLSNKFNYDVIQTCQIDVRNRIEALFMTDNAASWKCLTTDFTVVPPLNEEARSIYDFVSNSLLNNKKYDIKEFFNKFCDAPYGLSEEAAAMFLSMIIVNLWHNIRIQYDKERMTVAEWQGEVVDEKKIKLNIFKVSSLLWVDTAKIDAQFQQLFNKIQANKDIDEAKRLEDARVSLIKLNGLPEALAIHNELAMQRYANIEDIVHSWQKEIGDIEFKCDEAIRKCDIPNALEVRSCLKVKLNDFKLSFDKAKFTLPKAYMNKLNIIYTKAGNIINSKFDNWLVSKVYCKSIEQMKGFRNFCERCRNELISQGYSAQAVKLEEKCDKELSDKEEIKSRETLLDDGQRFITDTNNVSETNYIEIHKLLERSGDLDKRFIKYGKDLGSAAQILSQNVKGNTEKIRKWKEKMDKNLESVPTVICEATTLRDLEYANDIITVILGYNIREEKRSKYQELKELLEETIEDCHVLLKAFDDRKAFESQSTVMKEKYQNKTGDFNFLPVITDSIHSTEIKMRKIDEDWCRENVTLGDKTREDVYAWKQKIERLPAFLSEVSLKKVKELDKEADQLISEGKIEDVLYYFGRLDENEKEKCFTQLQEKYFYELNENK